MSKLRIVFIIIIAAALLGIVGLWVYLFLYTDSSSGGAFATLPSSGIRDGDSSDIVWMEPPISSSVGMPQVSRPLSQVTTRLAAGGATQTRNNEVFVRFVEQGTGHVYEVSLSSGAETRVSNRTFAKTKHAVWSQNGNRVAIVQETDGGEHAIFVGSIQRGDDGVEGLVGETLPDGAENIGFSASGDLVYYTLPNGNGTGGVSWNVASGARQTLFTTPLRDITVRWNPSPIIFTKPAATLIGYAYTASHGRAFPSMEGLVGMQDGAGNVLGTGIANGAVRSILSRGDQDIALALPALPEKCAFTNQNATLICAVPNELDPRTFPDRWYRGQEIFSDTFWTIDTTTGEAAVLVVPTEETGRSLDVVDFALDTSGAYGIFRNKTDATLWLLRR